MTNRTYLFLPQSDSHQFFSLWGLTLIKYLQSQDADLILCQLPGSTVQSNFLNIASLASLDLTLITSHLIEPSSHICAHVHDLFFQEWLQANFQSLPHLSTISFYTDGSNPSISRSHLNYFPFILTLTTNLNYIVFPAAHHFYFWWLDIYSSANVTIQKLTCQFVISIFSTLCEFYSNAVSSLPAHLDEFRELKHAAIVLLRPLRGITPDEAMVFAVFKYITDNCTNADCLIIKGDSRLPSFFLPSLVAQLASTNLKFLVIGSEFDSIPFEILLNSLTSCRFDSIDFHTFDGSFIFNYYLIPALPNGFSIFCYYPLLSLPFISDTCTRLLETQLRSASVLLKLHNVKFKSTISSMNSGRMFYFTSDRMTFLL